MKRSRLNMVIDLVSLAIFVLVVSTGTVLHLVLPPGSGRLPAEGGTHPEILVLWGLSRHQWGEIHSWFSVAFLIVLALHVGLHWRFFASAFRQKDPATRRRMATGFVSVIALLTLAMAPLLSPVKRLKVQETAPSELDPGRQIYEASCLRCHGADSSSLSSLPDGDEGLTFLRQARPAKAHAFMTEMSDDDLRQLLSFLRK